MAEQVANEIMNFAKLKDRPAKVTISLKYLDQLGRNWIEKIRVSAPVENGKLVWK